MKSIIVGTAGHIDHGKTALVKALTGIDADRLEEEKRRGITIDLGFAHLDLPLPGGETLHLGFVDVPGHERFVRNMLAGVGGIDLVLLVIAADESIKPQTREHFDILQLIGVKRGITVLTKSDAVDAETLDVVRLEVEEFLRGTFLAPPNAPIVPVSSLTGAGFEDLNKALVRAAAQIEQRDSQAIPRLPIDRVFTMKGFGTVVTGTLLSGAIHKDEELVAFPTGRQVRVRGVQVHGNSSDTAVAGQRTALNLTGAGTEDLSRGMTIAPGETFEPTRQIDVKLQLLASAPRPLKSRARIHFHSNTMETVAEVRLLRNPQISPGEQAYARIVLPEPALILPGDRFIVRQFSPVITIGGGRVLDASPMKQASDPAGFLKVAESVEPEKILVARIVRRKASGLSIERAISETGYSAKVIGTLLGAPLQQRQIARLGNMFVDAVAVDALKAGIIEKMKAFHSQNPLVEGISREQLREQQSVKPEMFGAVLEALVRDQKLDRVGELVRLPGRGVVMKDEEAESKKKIEDAFALAGLKVPSLQQVIAGLKVDKVRAQKIVTLLLRDKVLIKVSDELVFHSTALAELRRQLVAQKAKSQMIDVAAFKQLTGVSRKYAIPLLEYLDRERLTRRVGDARQIL